jgi:hypothetical protein
MGCPVRGLKTGWRDDGMNQSKAEEIVARLLSNAANLKYGAVSVSVNLYNGHVVQIVYSTTENTKAPIQKPDEEKVPKQ